MNAATWDKSYFVKLTVVSFLLLLSREPDWLTQTVSIVAPVSECLLSPEDVWQVPVSSTELFEIFSKIPYLIFAGTAACLIALLGSRFNRCSEFVPILLVVGLSLSMAPVDLLPGACCVLVVSLTEFSWFQARHSLLRMLLLSTLFLAILLSLEFSLVLIFLVSILWSTEQKHSQKIDRIIAVGLLLLLGLMQFFYPALSQTGIRPVSWMWMDVPTELIPRLESPLTVPVLWITLGSVVVATALGWGECDQRRLRDPLLLIGFLLFALIAFSSVHYLFLGSFAFLLLFSRFIKIPTTGIPGGKVLGVTIVVSLGLAGWQTNKLTLLAGQSAPSLVDPAQWNTGGNVILMNLDHSSDWNTGRPSDQFQLVLDDRWDVFGKEYHQYLSVCRDLKEVRINSYLKTDQTWGGYKLISDEWEASLLVVESKELLAIRGLTNSPHWKLMGIDGKRTIFGNQEVPPNLPQLKRAVDSVLFLEWPIPGKEVQLDNTIVANTDRDARHVANVLCMTRLPYAALRFIRNDHSSVAKKIRTRCYLELAHRVYRHSGVGSCLDQYRALARFKAESQQGQWEDTEAQMVLKSLSGLGLSVDQKNGKIQNSLKTETPRERIHAKLLSGDDGEAAKLLSKLGKTQQPYFSCLVKSVASSPEESMTCLNSVLDDETLRDDLNIRGDAWFYLGCLALETGESAIAIKAFQKCLEEAPNSPFRNVCKLNLRGLGAK